MEMTKKSVLAFEILSDFSLTFIGSLTGLTKVKPKLKVAKLLEKGFTKQYSTVVVFPPTHFALLNLVTNFTELHFKTSV
jgi:hypothetical protein